MEVGFDWRKVADDKMICANRKPIVKYFWFILQKLGDLGF